MNARPVNLILRRKIASKSAGKVLFYVLAALLAIFFISILVMVTRENPDETRRQNSDIRVEVLNGCGENRLAYKVTTVLRKDGYNVVQYGDASRDDFEETVVLERSKEDTSHAKHLARQFGCKNIGTDVDAALFIDVTLIIGKDYKRVFPNVEKEF